MADKLRAVAGSATTKAAVLSSPQELQHGSVVSGSGDPAHSPDAPVQDYTDVDTGTVWRWYLQTWVHQ